MTATQTQGETMRYFVFSGPYFGLIKAHSEQDARTTYQEVICDLEDTDTCEEISEEIALQKFVDACSSYKDFDPRKEFFEHPTDVPLLIDGCLL